jgi:hypothetical protein
MQKIVNTSLWLFIYVKTDLTCVCRNHRKEGWNKTSTDPQMIIKANHCMPKICNRSFILGVISPNLFL